VETPAFFQQYGYLLTFAAVFGEQIGLPVPAVPILVSMGAFSRSGSFSIVNVLLLALAASMAADLIWYNLGWHYGRSVLKILCRISLEPDSCIRRTEDAFVRRGLWSLLLTKFVPGLNAAAVPLAGMIRSPFRRFLAFDLGGLVLWAGGYTTLGFIFSNQLERLIVYIPRFGHSAAWVFGVVIVAYVAYKLIQRRRFLRTLDTGRITAEELKSKLDAHEEVMVFDLRNPLEVTTERIRIPGAFHILPDTLSITKDEFPRDKEIVLYCTCPHEATSARVAKQLRQMGIRQVRPLQGGLDAWRDRKFPIESL
jgi:membrane protein DedA with SNARE-associated domain/rhodanese-related sulfurtransferase